MNLSFVTIFSRRILVVLGLVLALTACGGGISDDDSDTTAPVMTLLGSNPVSAAVGSAYNDAGATASDAVDGNLTSSIITVNPVNTAVVGVYTVTYDVSDAAGNAATQVTRTVNIVNVADTTAPVMTLLGSNPVSAAVGSAYNDAGATASDAVDGNLTSSITTVNPVNTAVVGAYTVTYDVTDAAGNAATQITRTVNVVDTTTSIPAFPGAEGYGANSVGGRGGTIIKVTNLNDSGSGSFRNAVTASGPRIVVFDVSGIINLESEIWITNPYITIAGQTSPGGILVAGYMTLINTHNVIMRHMRFRVGSHRITDGSNANGETLDAFDIWGSTIPGGGNDAYNIIIDHSSFSWGVDENFSFSYAARDITVQWSIISEGLSNAGHPKGEHSKGMLISQKFGGVKNISVHHNYFAHNRDRNPLASGDAFNPVDIRNNVVYDYFHAIAMGVGSNAGANLVHNYVKQGPSSYVAWEAGYFDGPPAQNNMVYTVGNIGPRRTSQSDPEWMLGENWTSALASENYRRLTPWPSAPVTTQTASASMASCIVAAVGATAPSRDSVDARIVNDFAAGTGNIIDNVAYPADFPTFQTPAAPIDNDNDGMPDSWENSNGLDNETNDSALDKDGDGYTNIEEYLHSLSVGSYAYDSKCMPVT